MTDICMYVVIHVKGFDFSLKCKLFSFKCLGLYFEVNTVFFVKKTANSLSKTFVVKFMIVIDLKVIFLTPILNISNEHTSRN